MAAPDTDDGCTDFPEGNWHECCVAHDHEYRSIRYGVLNFAARRRADLALFRCVRSHGHPVVAALMFVGVRAFAWPAWFMNRWHRK